MARQRKPGREPERDQKCRPQEERPVEQPREEHERRHQGKAERHRHERDAEARLVRERREVAVHEIHERELERVFRPQDERGDADVDCGERAEAGEQVEPLREALRNGLAQDELADAERAEQEREREEEAPAGEVVGPRGTRGAVCLCRRGRLDAVAEREHAGPDVAVRGQDTPANRVGTADEPVQRHTHDPVIGAVRRWSGDATAVHREHLERVRDDPHFLVEAKDHLARLDIGPGLVRRARVPEHRVGEGSGRQRGGDERGRTECCQPSHFGAPASGER